MVDDTNLELKLCILHELFAVEGVGEVISNTEYSEMLEEVYEGRPLKSYIEELINIGSPSKDYISLLTKIRIFLLGS